MTQTELDAILQSLRHIKVIASDSAAGDLVRMSDVRRAVRDYTLVSYCAYCASRYKPGRLEKNPIRRCFCPECVELGVPLRAAERACLPSIASEKKGPKRDPEETQANRP